MQGKAVASVFGAAAISVATVSPFVFRELGKQRLARLNVATVSAPPGAMVATNPAAPRAVAAPARVSASAPVFDVVRVESSGEAVVAGRAEPRSALELRDGERTIATIPVDESGEFAVSPLALGEGPHHLQLVERDGAAQGAHSDVVEVEPLRLKPAPPIGATPTPTTSPGSNPPTALDELALAPVVTNPTLPAVKPAGDERTAAIGEPAAPLPSAAPAIPPPREALATNEPTIALPALALRASDPPAEAVPTATAAAETSSHPGSDSHDHVVARSIAAGFADPLSRVRLTLNGAPLAKVIAGGDRFLSLTTKQGMTAGLYPPRTEEVDHRAGSALARAEAPFAYPRRAAASRVEPKPEVAAVFPPRADVSPLLTLAYRSHAIAADARTTTVARGDNLWDLARRFYGRGMRYSYIYLANVGLIRKPSMIFIGQIFVVPPPGARQH